MSGQRISIEGVPFFAASNWLPRIASIFPDVPRRANIYYVEVGPGLLAHGPAGRPAPRMTYCRPKED